MALTGFKKKIYIGIQLKKYDVLAWLLYIAFVINEICLPVKMHIKGERQGEIAKSSPKYIVVIFHVQKLVIISSKGNNLKTEQDKSCGSCTQPFVSLQEICIPSLESFEPMVTKLHSGQGKREDD